MAGSVATWGEVQTLVLANGCSSNNSFELPVCLLSICGHAVVVCMGGCWEIVSTCVWAVETICQSQAIQQTLHHNGSSWIWCTTSVQNSPFVCCKSISCYWSTRVPVFCGYSLFFWICTIRPANATRPCLRILSISLVLTYLHWGPGGNATTCKVCVQVLTYHDHAYHRKVPWGTMSI